MVRRVSLITGERANQDLRLPERDTAAQRSQKFSQKLKLTSLNICACTICAAMDMPVLNFSLESLRGEVHPSVNGFFWKKNRGTLAQPWFKSGRVTADGGEADGAVTA